MSGDRLSSLSLGDMSDVPSDFLPPLLDVARGEGLHTRNGVDSQGQAPESGQQPAPEAALSKPRGSEGPATDVQPSTAIPEGPATPRVPPSAAAGLAGLQPLRRSAQKPQPQLTAGNAAPALQAAVPGRKGAAPHTEGWDATSQFTPAPPSRARASPDSEQAQAIGPMRQLPRVCHSSFCLSDLSFHMFRAAILLGKQHGASASSQQM